MASAFTHAFVGTVIGKTLNEKKEMPWRFYMWLAVFAALPDMDVIGMAMGVPYASPWGHRGFTHSILFAAITAAAAVVLLFWDIKHFSKVWWWLWFCFFLAIASHGFLDAFTNGGMGIAFYWPFDNTRYFFPWRPILVSPIGISRFWGDRAILILESEFLWVWLPTLLLYALWGMLRPKRNPK